MRGRLNTVGLQKDEFNPKYELYPYVTLPPAILTSLLNTFSQYTYADQIVPGEYVTYVLKTQSSNTITMIEGTTFEISSLVIDPSRLNESDTSNVSFIWTKNNSPLYELNSKNNLKGEKTIRIENCSREASGIYRLEVRNDYGSTISDELTIDVVNVDNHPLMFKNLIENPNGARGTEGWTFDADFLTQRFYRPIFGQYHTSINPQVYVDPENKKRPYKHDFYFDISNNEIQMPFSFDKIKSLDLNSDPYWLWLVRNYLPTLVSSEVPTDIGGVYPAPKYLDLANKNGNFMPLHKQLEINKTYFTRDKIKFTTFGGNANCVAYQDIDVSSVENIIDGEAYGIDKLLVHFFAYIGIGISRYKTRYTTRDGDVFENNTIPLNYTSYVSSSLVNEILEQSVKPPLLPYLPNVASALFTEMDVEQIISTYCPKDPTGQFPIVRFWPFSGEWSDLPITVANDPWPNIKATGLEPYANKIAASGYWIGFVANEDGNGYEKVPGTDDFRVWFTKISDPNSIRTPDGRAVKLIRIPDEWSAQYYKVSDNTAELLNNDVRLQNIVNIKKNSDFELEPVTDDITEVRLDFLDSDNYTIESTTITGPTAKDIWAVKEKFYMPFYIANMYGWITDLTSQQVKIYNKPYTTVSAVRAVSKTNTTMDLHSGWVRRYLYALLEDIDIKQKEWWPDIGYDRGGAALFGISADIQIPVKTRTIRVNVIFKHLSSTLYDTNPKLKGWNQEDIYYDYLSSTNIDRRVYAYGNPRCCITNMHLSLHPNNVIVSDKHPTYKIPAGNKWYKHKRLIESSDLEVFNSIGPQGSYPSLIGAIDSLQYRYNIEADNAEEAFRLRPDEDVIVDVEREIRTQDSINNSLNPTPTGIDLRVSIPDSPRTPNVILVDGDSYIQGEQELDYANNARNAPVYGDEKPSQYDDRDISDN